jgi:hypothetical protein
MKLKERNISFRILGGLALVCLSWTVPDMAGARELGTFKDWSAHILVENNGKICYLHAVPSKSEGKYSKRGDTYIQVTHRTSSKIRNEVSVTAGYTYNENNPPTLEIDGKKFLLFTQGDTAWADERNPDDRVVAAMRAGRNLIVGGTSSRGTVTVDSYSLSGFTAAHNAINKACAK